MMSIVGLLTILVIVALLITQRVHPIIALTTIPFIGALIAGFGLSDITEFFNDGIASVLSVVIMFIFAILFFGIMQDAGMFNPLIDRMVKISRGNIIVVAVVTVVIGALAHMDGAGASTFLITIPALLPLYKKLNMSPYLLVLLVGLSASIINMVPWGGTTRSYSSSAWHRCWTAVGRTDPIADYFSHSSAYFCKLPRLDGEETN